MTEAVTCLLCGNDRRSEIRTGLVQWAERVNGKIFDAIPRCSERGACRDRVRARGEDWPVVDRDAPAVRELEGRDREPAADQPIAVAAAAAPSFDEPDANHEDPGIWIGPDEPFEEPEEEPW